MDGSNNELLNTASSGVARLQLDANNSTGFARLEVDGAGCCSLTAPGQQISLQNQVLGNVPFADVRGDAGPCRGVQIEASLENSGTHRPTAAKALGARESGHRTPQKKGEYMQKLPYVEVTYCSYGYSHRKLTNEDLDRPASSLSA